VRVGIAKRSTFMVILPDRQLTVERTETDVECVLWESGWKVAHLWSPVEAAISRTPQIKVPSAAEAPVANDQHIVSLSLCVCVCGIISASV
jgi:hypothetical protein